MTPRSQRRAAERIALKEARRKEKAQFAELKLDPTPEPTTHPIPTRTISPAQFAANRTNSKLSSGPTSLAGKAISSRNHTQHGLTSQPTGPLQVLPTENQSAYDALLAAYTREWQPSTATEFDLVQRLATHSWLRGRATHMQNDVLLKASGDMGPLETKQFELLGRYQSTHARAYNRAFGDIMRLRNFQLRHRKEEAAMARRAEESKLKNEIRFESQKLKAEAHAARMESIRLKQEALKQRNNRLLKPETSVSLAPQRAESVSEAAA